MNHTALLASQRKQAKIGMSVALGTLVASSLMSPNNAAWAKRARTLHVCAGVTLVGCVYWHWSLYHSNPGQRR